MTSRAEVILLALLASAVAAGAQVINNGTLPGGGKILALLVAGSNGYENYRHQADVCHAYQILRANGIPKENIIVMMYDDIAYNPKNPTPGVIINHPNGTNVYAGVQIDYKKSDVNPETFLAVLQGNSTAVKGKGSGRVIQSGPNDHIFINFSDHGGTGILCFPDGLLHRGDLVGALKNLAAKKKFEKLVLYVEACEAGSMFDSVLPDNINVFAMTAAKPHEPSEGCYYDNFRQTFLGDLFSVNWMEDADIEDLTKETLDHQFEVVRNKTKASHVQEYGDLGLGSTVMSEILGSRKAVGSGSMSARQPTVITDAVPSRDVPLHILYNKLESAKTEEETRDLQLAINKLLKARLAADSIVDEIIRLAANGNKDVMEQFSSKEYRLDKSNERCYEHTVQFFDDKCFKLAKNRYLLKHLYKFVNMCSSNEMDQKSILGSIERACQKNHLTGVV